MPSVVPENLLIRCIATGLMSSPKKSLPTGFSEIHPKPNMSRNEHMPLPAGLVVTILPAATAKRISWYSPNAMLYTILFCNHLVARRVAIAAVDI